MPNFCFVGEDRSPTARRNGWRWEDGRLAAVPLFAALRACGINPKRCKFVNWFEDDPTTAIDKMRGHVVVALGERAHEALEAAGIHHLRLTHPAARGSIRKRERYIEHVRQVLSKAK